MNKTCYQENHPPVTVAANEEAISFSQKGWMEGQATCEISSPAPGEGWASC